MTIYRYIFQRRLVTPLEFGYCMAKLNKIGSNFESCESASISCSYYSPRTAIQIVLSLICWNILIIGIRNNYLNCFWFNIRCRVDRLTTGVPQPFKHRCFSSQLVPSSEQYFPLPDGGGSMQRLIRFLIHLFVPSFIVHVDHSPHVPQLPSIQNRMKHW